MSERKTEITAAVRKSDGIRKGKGFSRDELKEAGLDFRRALELRLQVDTRRRTKHNENVKTLKQLLRKR